MPVPSKDLYNSSSDSDEPIEVQFKVPTAKAPKTPAKKGIKRAAGAKARKGPPVKNAKMCWPLLNAKLAAARDSLERELPQVKKAKMADKKPSVSKERKRAPVNKAKVSGSGFMERKVPQVKKPKMSPTGAHEKPSGSKERKAPQVMKAKVSLAVENDKPSGFKEVIASKKTASFGPIVLEKQREVHIKEFRGRKTVYICDHNDKNGKVLPGKKGISLSVNQWKQLMDNADEITRAIEE